MSQISSTKPLLYTLSKNGKKREDDSPKQKILFYMLFKWETSILHKNWIKKSFDIHILLKIVLTNHMYILIIFIEKNIGASALVFPQFYFVFLKMHKKYCFHTKNAIKSFCTSKNFFLKLQ